MNPEPQNRPVPGLGAWVAKVGSDPDDFEGWTGIGNISEDREPPFEEQHACYCLVPTTDRDTGARHYFQSDTCQSERPARRYAIVNGVWYDRLDTRREPATAPPGVAPGVTLYPTGETETRDDGAIGEHMTPVPYVEPWRILAGTSQRSRAGPCTANTEPCKARSGRRSSIPS